MGKAKSIVWVIDARPEACTPKPASERHVAGCQSMMTLLGSAASQALAGLSKQCLAGPDETMWQKWSRHSCCSAAGQQGCHGGTWGQEQGGCTAQRHLAT